MNITEALEKGKGKASRLIFGGWYAGNDHAGYLSWFTKKGSRQTQVAYDQIICTDWLPYNSEPEKCEACQEAEEIMESHDAMMVQVTARYAAHLRKFHCTCKKGEAK